jgi:hypothetical protein
MKTACCSLFLCCSLGSVASAAEHLWESFDGATTGSVAALPGWTRAAWLGTTTAQVSMAHACSQPHALELPWHASGSSAVFTNFSSTYATNEHPVIRCSASLYLAATSTPFQIGLRNSAAGHFLKFINTNGYGQFGFQTHDVHFAPLATGTFADVTFFYNRSNNTYRLDYLFTNRVPWALADSDPVTHTQFNQFVAYRPGGGEAGEIFLDDVSVETFPPYVWAWWRCTSLPSARFIEQLGTFPPTYRGGYADTDRPGASDPVWDGTADFHNQGATRMLVAGPTNCASVTPFSTNWTVEAVVRMPADANNSAFLDWGTSLGFDTNTPWIGVGYIATHTSIYLNVRDTQQADGSYQYLNLGPFRPNGRWQHVALVKSNDTATLYVDYQSITSRVLSAAGDGAYAFGSASRATVGLTLNGGNTSGPDTLLDEVRFSGKALARSEFLQPGQPLIVEINGDALNNDPWPLTAKCILGKSYHLETSASCGPDADWQAVPGTTFTSAYTFDFIDVPSTVPRTNFVRIMRED